MKKYNTKKEVWKDVVGYEGLYEISSFGRLKRLKRTTLGKDGIEYNYPELIIKGDYDKDGYIRTTMSKNKKKKTKKLHRLVAEAFIPNPNNYPEVNHLDETKDNNHVDNLEWVTVKGNANYGTRNERITNHPNQIAKINSWKKPVRVTNLRNGKIKTYESATKASKHLGLDQTLISRGCRNGTLVGTSKGKGYKVEYIK